MKFQAFPPQKSHFRLCSTCIISACWCLPASGHLVCKLCMAILWCPSTGTCTVQEDSTPHPTPTPALAVSPVACNRSTCKAWAMGREGQGCINNFISVSGLEGSKDFVFRLVTSSHCAQDHDLVIGDFWMGLYSPTCTVCRPAPDHGRLMQLTRSFTLNCGNFLKDQDLHASHHQAGQHSFLSCI